MNIMMVKIMRILCLIWMPFPIQNHRHCLYELSLNVCITIGRGTIVFVLPRMIKSISRQYPTQRRQWKNAEWYIRSWLAIQKKSGYERSTVVYFIPWKRPIICNHTSGNVSNWATIVSTKQMKLVCPIYRTIAGYFAISLSLIGCIIGQERVQCYDIYHCLFKRGKYLKSSSPKHSRYYWYR